MSSSEWEVLPLEDCMEAIIDYRGKTPRKSSFGIPLITAKIVKGGRILEPTEFIPFEDYDERMSRGIPRAGDVVVTTEAPLGEVGQLDNRKLSVGQRLITLRGKDGLLDNTYLKYLMMSEFVQNQLLARATGTTVSGIKQTELRKINLLVPPFTTQRRIADILSTLDEKIELNRQTNATLEAIAQSIFREWFVGFNYPNATDEMVKSELGMIPQGWKVGKIKELCNVNKNVITKKDNFDWIDYIEISEVTKGKIGNVSRYKYGEEPSRARRKLNHGDTVLSTVRPNRGSFFLSINPPSTLIASTGFAVFSPTKAPYSFLYLLLTDPEKLEYYGHVADGAAYPAVNPNLIMDMDIVIPEDGILNRFHSIAEPILNTMIHNEQQSATLAALRDALLPKLMNGEIEVSND